VDAIDDRRILCDERTPERKLGDFPGQRLANPIAVCEQVHQFGRGLVRNGFRVARKQNLAILSQAISVFVFLMELPQPVKLFQPEEELLKAGMAASV